LTGLLTSIFTAFNGAGPTAIHTSLSGRMFTGYAPPGTAFPYAVVSIPSQGNDWTFGANAKFDDIDIQFNIYSQSASQSEIGTCYTNMRTLYDDTTLVVPGGVHTMIYMQYDMAWLLFDPEEDVRQYVLQYNVLLQS